MATSVTVEVKASEPYRDPPAPRRKCPCCQRVKKLRASHHRGFTQEEMDYSRILRVEAAHKRAMEQK